MKKKLLLFLIPLLITGCSLNNQNSSVLSSKESNNNDSEDNSLSSDSSTLSIDSLTSEEDSIYSDTSNISESSTESDDEFQREKLDCGYYQMPLPKNNINPYELVTTLSDNTTWSNNYLYDELPANFRFIYGNSYDDGPSGSKASPSFYSYNADNTSKYPGGLKMDQKSKGFQTFQFTHSGAKLEIRLGISQINNASGKPEEGVDTLRIYYFNNVGKYLGQHSVVARTLKQGTTKEIKYYETSTFTCDIAYLEVRQISMAYKGSQCYNFGISYCHLKSWERI